MRKKKNCRLKDDKCESWKITFRYSSFSKRVEYTPTEC